MRVWLITVGEPLPIDGTEPRLHRTGMLADVLVGRGHDVVWWTSSFDHFSKRHRFPDDHSVIRSECYRIQLLHSIGYRKNISIRRLIDHYGVARKFSRLAEADRKPDVIVCSLPTIELSLAAVEYGRGKGVPVVLDVRDLWPDIFRNALPKSLLPIGVFFLKAMEKKVRQALRGATALVSISSKYLEWGLRYAGREATPRDAVFPLGYRAPVVNEERLEAAAATLRGLGVAPDKLIFWFVGTFGNTYDLHTVIEGARRLREINDIQFVLSGNGEHDVPLRARAKGLSNVVFTGWLDTAQIACMMRFAGIGLAAYAKRAPQGVPNKIYEYLCAGIPIMSSLRGETEALLREGECGVTYAAGDVDSFIVTAQALSDEAELRRRMGENGRQLFESRFSAERIYSDMANFVEGIASSSVKWRLPGGGRS